MFALGVSDHVMIAHSFRDPFFGPAQRLHGATYTVEARVEVLALGPHHVVMDIGALRTLLRDVLVTLDYTNLDDHPAFPGRTSTTEKVAEHVAKELVDKLRTLRPDVAPPRPAKLTITLRESPVAWASYETHLT